MSNNQSIMTTNKKAILKNICYTELVYGRINKKLDVEFSKSQIESFIFRVIKETKEKFFVRRGKNFYITNTENNLKVTVNSNTFKIITVDRIRKYDPCISKSH